MSRLLTLSTLLSTSLLIGCASVNAPAKGGNSPAERVHAVKTAPLSSDPDSPLNDVYANDGAVSIAVKKF